MPKDRRERSLSLDSSRLSPFPCSSGCSKQFLPVDPLEDEKNMKEWEEARCPVCMEHPHNAILLICSSHDKGCRPFMCDTSYRHSNCFDQFRKSFNDSSEEILRDQGVQDLASPLLSAPPLSESAVPELEGEGNLDGSLSTLAESFEKAVKPELLCPLCRGQINGWTVVDSARCFMNTKARSCASETCDFSGTYKDLRVHARAVHPLVRPTDADPQRQDNWRRLERQRDLGDLLSTLQSSIGEERSGESTLTVDDGGWLTVFFLVRLIRPRNSTTRTRTSRARAQVAVRRPLRLWGETYDGVADSIEEGNESSDSGQTTTRRRRYVRRRLNDPGDNE
ncbi:uncharacterized protein LOC125196154 isoform X1 [Salvia hispanica]|uniref:uncharacterized protein LOC125196154 isoform X1 n=2 Tax=Salvia hispanica TaxID=49212 RepID=UPI002009369A|nr:uncharacterized protein LOC125196154 isoform X1 [Salvia hispanica]